MPKNIPSLTADEVRAMLDYDPATGIFRWKVSKKGREIGRPAGASHNLGYRIEDAHQAYMIAARQHFGEFARAG